MAGALVNAMTLSATGAVVGTLIWLGGFLVFERFSSAAAAHPAVRPPSLAVPARLTLVNVGPAALALFLLLRWLPPTSLKVPGPIGVEVAAPNRLVAVYNVVALASLAAGASLFGLVRLLRRGKRAQASLSEAVEVTGTIDEAVPLRPRHRRVAYPGLRGRVVQAYLRFLAAAEQRVGRRPPSQTPRELAAVVGEPAGLLNRLTDLFVQARYGPDEPSEAETREAERTAVALLIALRRPRR